MSLVKTNKQLYFSFKLDPLILKMVNLLMREGKKEKAEKILYKIFYFLEENYPGEALNILYLAVFHTQTFMGARLKAQGKKFRRKNKVKNIFTPYFLLSTRSQISAIRSLFFSGQNRSLSRPLWENLGEEFLEAAFNKGNIIEKRDEIHKIVKNNKRRYPRLWVRKYKNKFNFLDEV
uniref:Ribosomal protein S7 n=1 Tax=Protohalopteris sp. TaxID=2843287 RepID=A0A8F0FCZ3_9PHAE|nr:ribosomal protein S7 [Protohalopteris sp.]